MNILHIAPSFYPATYWGGPIQSTKAICDGIAARDGFALRVLTTDAAGPAPRDRVRRVPLPYPVRYFRRVAGHAVAPALLAALPRAIAWADVVHLTGTYSFPTLPVLALARMMRRPVVWSPRGALQATEIWGDAPRKRAKHLFADLAQALRPADTILHVTSTAEAQDSITRLQGITTALIPNCVTIPDLPPRMARQGQLRLVYLGRLHPKKGVDLLIRAMGGLPEYVTLDIYGMGAAADVAALQALAQPFGARIRFRGEVQGPAKTRALAAADLLVLPSHAENFGIVVAEALAHGLPVLTTTATPWRALGVMGAGAVMDLARDDLATAILTLARDDLAAMGARGRDWMIRDHAPWVMVDSFAALYRKLGPARGQMVPA
jgi:glycosyltransferase involved in cell wall biosynthesis